MLSLLFLSSPTTTTIVLNSLSKRPPLFKTTLTRSLSFITTTKTTMSINLKTHSFAGNPLRSKTPKSTDPFSPSLALETLKNQLLDNTLQTQFSSSLNFKVLPFRKGRPLATCSDGGGGGGDMWPKWRLGWISLSEFKGFLADSGVVELKGESFVFLGSRSDAVEGDHDGHGHVVFWAIDVSSEGGLVPVLSAKQFCFVELRTLMVATNWADDNAMGDLAVAGHARALLEWQNLSQFCGNCGAKTVPMEAGRRKQCSNEQCAKRIYPRVDPVVIMLVIDRENDRVLVSRQSRFVPRMWSCLAGFMEPGESLEEAVRRETWEETGIEVGEVVYHSSQPWPVGPSSMPCQLMVGFFAYAKTLEINVDKSELEDAQWHSREDVRKALIIAEYEKAQRTAAAKVNDMCKGVERAQSLSGDFNVESGELAPMFFPGPFAIAHHLISSWINQRTTIGSSSLSNL